METGVVVYDSEGAIYREIERNTHTGRERDYEQDLLTRSMYQ